MWFWWVMLFCDLLIPVTMLIGGRAMWKTLSQFDQWFVRIPDASFHEKIWTHGNLPMITADVFGGSWDYGCLFHRF